MLIRCKSYISPYLSKVGSVMQYFNDIRRYPVLGDEEERKLLAQAHGKDETARRKATERLVNCNQRFVASAAMKQTNGEDMMDLVNEGNIGLLAAIERFDLKKDNKFITYAAWWIQKCINIYLTNYRNMVIPANANKLRTIANKVRGDFYIKEERQPMLHEVQAILRDKYGFNIENLVDLETYQAFSIDACTEYDEDETFAESPVFTKLTATNNIEEGTDIEDCKKVVAGLLGKLDERDRLIIERLFGIGCDEQPYEAIASELGLTKERIRQKSNEIIRKLGNYVKKGDI